MEKKITCKQIQAILPFYIKGRVNPALTEIIEDHLATCQKCKELYLRAFEEYNDFPFLDAEIELNDINDVEEEFENNDRFMTKEYVNFKKKLSAYLDSELEDKENIKIKKMTISNPLARKDLEDMYLFKRLLHSSFERTKENCKFDFSKQIIKKLDDQNFYQTDYFVRLGAILLFISAVLSISIFVGN